jgi:signal transduction histidine kinase
MAERDRRAEAARAIDELHHEVSELRASRRRLVLAADAERRAFERDLHDGVQQQLVGLAAHLELAAGSVDADPEETKRLLGELRREAQRALEDARGLAHRLYPPMLEAGGLSAALRAAAESANVPMRIDVAPGMAPPPEIGSAVYLCCLDVLERAGPGTPVMLRVRGEEGALAFEIVADRDVGPEPLVQRDRIEALGGRLAVHTASGETRVAGSLPLSG